MKSLMHNQNNRIIYIVEHFTWSLDDSIVKGGVSVKALKTLLINLQLVSGVSVFFSSSNVETCKIVQAIYDRIASMPHKYVSNEAKGDYTPSVKIKKSANLQDSVTCACMQLSMIPRVSSGFARKLLEHLQCESICDFVTKLSVMDSPADLASIKIGSKCIGKAMAINLFNCLGIKKTSLLPDKGSTNFTTNL